MGTRWNHLTKAVLTSTHNLCFEQKYEKYQSFLADNFQFLEVKFSIYLNRHVFVMSRKNIQQNFPFFIIFMEGIKQTLHNIPNICLPNICPVVNQDRYMDVQYETIIPCHYHVTGYKMMSWSGRRCSDFTGH